MELALANTTVSNLTITLLNLSKQMELKDAEIARLREQLARGSFAVDEAPVTATKAKKSGKPTKPKDPNAPKKPATAWMMWKNEVFGPAFKISNPGESIAKASGIAWKALSDEEQAPWQSKYDEAKANWVKATRTVTFVSDEAESSEQSDEVSAINPIENDIASDSDEESDSESVGIEPEMEADEEAEKADEEAKKAEKVAKKAAKKATKKDAKKAEKDAKKAAKKATKKAEKDAIHDSQELKETVLEESCEVVDVTDGVQVMSEAEDDCDSM